MGTYIMYPMRAQKYIIITSVIYFFTVILQNRFERLSTKLHILKQIKATIRIFASSTIFTMLNTHPFPPYNNINFS